MSSDATAQNAPAATDANNHELSSADAPVVNKGKGKLVQDNVMDDEDDEEEEEEEEDDDDDMVEDNLEEIDPSVILAPGTRRSTRDVRVDYSSVEALKKAGLNPDQPDEDDHNEESFVAPEEDMKDD